MRLAAQLLCIRVRNQPEKLFAPNSRGIFMDETSYKVNVYETAITANSDAEQLAAYVASFVVFQIKHVRGLDATIEILEYLSGIRKRCENRTALSLSNLL